MSLFEYQGKDSEGETKYFSVLGDMPKERADRIAKAFGEHEGILYEDVGAWPKTDSHFIWVDTATSQIVNDCHDGVGDVIAYVSVERLVEIIKAMSDKEASNEQA